MSEMQKIVVDGEEVTINEQLRAFFKIGAFGGTSTDAVMKDDGYHDVSDFKYGICKEFKEGNVREDSKSPVSKGLTVVLGLTDYCPDWTIGTARGDIYSSVEFKLLDQSNEPILHYTLSNVRIFDNDTFVAGGKVYQRLKMYSQKVATASAGTDKDNRAQREAECDLNDQSSLAPVEDPS